MMARCLTAWSRSDQLMSPPVMPSADEYRAEAIGCLIEADRTSAPKVRQQLLSLAMAYAKLVEISEQNGRTDPVDETPPPKPPSMD